MKSDKLSHVDQSGNPTMVDVSGKDITLRTASAQAIVNVGAEVMTLLKNDEIITKKGPVFQTAIIAGIMASKKTADLIPFCHPLAIQDCKITITTHHHKVILTSMVKLEGRTGVEMEALTAVSVAALTIYDMCKALSHDIIIEEIKLMEKQGGKKDFKRP